MSASGHSMNRSREEKPSGSLWCYFFVILPNASYDDRICCLPALLKLKFLHFYSINQTLFKTGIYCGQVQNNSSVFTHYRVNS